MSDWRITPLGDGSFKLSPFNEGGEGGEGILPWIVLFVLGLWCFDMRTTTGTGWYAGYIGLISIVCCRSHLAGWLLVLGMSIYLVCRA